MRSVSLTGKENYKFCACFCLIIYRKNYLKYGGFELC